MDLLALAAALAVMGAIVAGATAFALSSASPRTNVNRRLGSIISGEAGGLTGVAAQTQVLRPKRVGRVPIISGLLEGRASTEQTALRLERADIRLTVSEFVSLRFFLALVLALAVILFVPAGIPRLIGVLAVAFGGYMLPSMWVSHSANRRAAKLGKQLPEALTLISNSIKAGFGLMQALDLAGREMEHPFSTEIRRTLRDMNVGASSEDALQNMATRSGNEDLDIVVTAMVIQQTTGGNLSEILDNVAHTLRERIRIRGEIKTLTSQQMLTGFVIGGLPFVMVGLFSLVNPEYMKPLFTTTGGHLMLAGAAVLEFFGIMLIKRILAIEV